MVRTLALLIAAVAVSSVAAAPVYARKKGDGQASAVAAVAAPTPTAVTDTTGATSDDDQSELDSLLAPFISSISAAAAATAIPVTTANPAVEASILPIASAASASAAAAQASVIATADPNSIFQPGSAEDAGKEAFLKTKLQLEQEAGDVDDAAQTQKDLNDFNDQLIGALQACFADFLKEQKAQTNRLIEELKPKPVPTTDKKTAFWNAYKTLADEHDKEFLQRYSTDLDTSLIFAGLFSAVDSAFIIQIQPEIQPHGTRSIVILAQCLLYISLFSTLLASLLAVLGKQWLMYYSAAGEKGSLETRGLERQRKFDGRVKWKFDAVIQMFPLLLQFGLGLFWAALTIYLWTIHPSIASIVLVLTLSGLVAYVFLLRSAVVHADSPFQTPLASIMVYLSSTQLWKKSQAIFKQMTTPLFTLFTAFGSAISVLIHHSRDVLPRFSKPKLELSNSKELVPLLMVPKPSPA
ncbi:hypothetical protein C8R45DRAFT_1164782 [Mycena sanguinolenta]|nr:hypothetical protein C8R45DRAFT_1164782 [Mycena sanguinolenta]